MKYNTVYIIAGPTAVGKSSAAISLAKKLDGEIVNCDSVQLYKYMDIWYLHQIHFQKIV